jgi:hypothetical protein
VHLQLFQSFQEGLKACAHPPGQPRVGAHQKIGVRPREPHLPPAAPGTTAGTPARESSPSRPLRTHKCAAEGLRAVMVFSPKTMTMQHDSILHQKLSAQVGPPTMVPKDPVSCVPRRVPERKGVRRTFTFSMVWTRLLTGNWRTTWVGTGRCGEE